MDQSATLTVARRTWNQAVGQYGETVLPNRPAEGDLIFYPRTNALLEITFVQHANPFYQFLNQPSHSCAHLIRSDIILLCLKCLK